MPRVDPRVPSSIAVLAAAVWLGGMLALGAIVAPVVFGVVPAPTSADAMTVVFRRFDSVSMTCAVVLLVAEAALAAGREAATRVDVVRMVASALAAALAIVEGVWLSPAIQALHQAGAIRGVGALGIELDAKHHVAEMDGKAQVFLLVVVLVAHVVSVGRGAGR